MDDPVYTRWKRQHPRFPGVAECVELLRRRNVKGSLVDIICGELRANATAHSAELIAALRAERDRIRRIILSIISETGLPEALPLLEEHLWSSDEGLRHWAAAGLRRLNTPQAREVLSKADYPCARTDSN
jgi:hypothetical protein